MASPKIPNGYALLENVKDEGPIADELCYCGALKSEHKGFQGHGRCDRTGCVQFTWFGFVKKSFRGFINALGKVK